MTTTFRRWLSEFAELHGQPTAFVVGGGSSWGDYGLDRWPPVERTVVLDELPDAFLDYRFDEGYGAPGCPAMYAWSETHVFFVDTYDGSTSWCSIPRNPLACNPMMPGGG